MCKAIKNNQLHVFVVNCSRLTCDCLASNVRELNIKTIRNNSELLKKNKMLPVQSKNLYLYNSNNVQKI